MKTLLASLAVIAVAGCAVNAEPVGQRTPNGGFEYYSNYHANQGTVENGCILPWKKANQHTMGYNPKRVDMGEASTFTDCNIKEVKQVVVVEQPAPAPMPAPEPAPAPKVEQPAPAPMPAPAPAPMPAPKPIKE